ncbi:hypothetical protein CROQUDRAFT_661450 [Cronartium quercuum f. sp. fusiforme G11]|uniref:Ubiquitin-like domain-containing protein n=1 Tax=Cronartium quercuum f. sp. fusiforme G11 TaxID=708437 RepID=A0A9P6NCB6_9BASI|nr:hypothetical protein CROQUDRAFT_661450 [Cronartium quercuum f. sp. fusiforme G11]
MARHLLSNNVVFKYGDRLVMSENPKNLDAARREAGHLFGFERCTDIHFMVHLPHHGMAELSSSSWRNLEYGSVIEVVLKPSNQTKSSCEGDIQIDVRNSDEVVSSQKSRPSSTHSDGTAVDSLDCDAPKTIDMDANRLNSVSGLNLMSFDQSDPIISLQVELPIENGLQETMIVDVRRSQGFQVMFGDLSYKLDVPTERLQLWLLRDKKIIRISPMTSPAEVGLLDGDRMRVRIRGNLARQPPPPTPSAFPIAWNDSFLKPPALPRGPSLPTSPSFGRSINSCTLSAAPLPKRFQASSKNSVPEAVDLIRNMGQWNLGIPLKN